MAVQQEQVRQIIGAGDEDVIDYIVQILEDEHFEFGEDAAEAFEAIGPLLVSGGCAVDDDAAHEMCRKIQTVVRPSVTAAEHERIDGRGESESMKTSNGEAFRALHGGPVTLDRMNDIVLHPSDKFDGKKLIQGVFREGDSEDYTVMSDRDAAKLRKQKEKTEKTERAVYEAHRAAAETFMAGNKVEIVRNLGGPVVKDIHLNGVSISNGGADLISDADISLVHGHKYGLVGRNGTGKTSLLRALANREIEGLPTNCQILHVEQEIAGTDKSVLDTVLECDAERTRLLEEESKLLQVVDQLSDLKVVSTDVGGDQRSDRSGASTAVLQQLEEVSKRLIEIDAEGAKSRAASILSGLSFSTDKMHQSTNSLSGGWRMRVALARALFVEPDLLLLDEPTNHLDIEAITWLTDCLRAWTKTIAIVSHMRSFLNEVVTDVVHLQGKRLVSYKGNYDDFVKAREERLRCEKAAAEAQAARREHMQAFVDKFRYNAKRASLVQSRIKALDRMEDPKVTIEDDPEYHFVFPTPNDVVGPSIISFDNVAFHYQGKPDILRNLDFGIDMRSRIAIVGANGAGKSTLLNLICGVLEPTEGRIGRNPKARIATFSQHHVDGMDLALTPLEYMKKCFPNGKEPEHRAHLASFGITAELASQRMFSLSGGQKSRVALSKVTWIRPHLLLLDEPSNHLDIDAVDALIRGLSAFEGGLLMVSHDEYLIDQSVKDLWVVENCTVTVWNGDFSSYKRRLRKRLGVSF